MVGSIQDNGAADSLNEKREEDITSEWAYPPMPICSSRLGNTTILTNLPSSVPDRDRAAFGRELYANTQLLFNVLSQIKDVLEGKNEIKAAILLLGSKYKMVYRNLLKRVFPEIDTRSVDSILGAFERNGIVAHVERTQIDAKQRRLVEHALKSQSSPGLGSYQLGKIKWYVLTEAGVYLARYFGKILWNNLSEDRQKNLRNLSKRLHKSQKELEFEEQQRARVEITRK